MLIILFAAAIALDLHDRLRALTRRLLAHRSPKLFSMMTQMRGLTRLALLILAMLIAVPVAPIEPRTKAPAGPSSVDGDHRPCQLGHRGGHAHRRRHLNLRRYRLDTEDNLLARKHNTQVRVLLRSADVMVFIITIGAMLMTVPEVAPIRDKPTHLGGRRRHRRRSRRAAGAEQSIRRRADRVTQPIRIEDGVVVECEFGNIEEITSTYVVVRLWDLRRMVLPLTYFIEKPFQNWKREANTMIGTVMLHVDYRAPVVRIRAKAEEIVKASPKWDGQTLSVQVTELNHDSMQIRILASSRQSFDLRCEVRECADRLAAARASGSDAAGAQRGGDASAGNPRPRRSGLIGAPDPHHRTSYCAQTRIHSLGLRA